MAVFKTSGVALAGRARAYSGTTVVSNGTLTVYTGSSISGSPSVEVVGGTLKLSNNGDGLSDTASLHIADGGGAKVYVKAGLSETVGSLYLGTRQARRGTWGAIGSGATYIDSTHFSGTGVIRVSSGPETVITIR